MEALLATGGTDVLVCQCEEVTAREILEVRPPRYLDWQDERRNDRSLSALLGEGPPNPRPDQAADPRRHGPVPGPALPRAGRGPAGARRRRSRFRRSRSPATAPRSGRCRWRCSALPEAPEQAEHWDTWFGMHAQWRPFWEVPERYTVASNDATGPVASE
jgi:hypothetical protein